jgi:chromosomal replication initiation ATPase DnaA
MKEYKWKKLSDITDNDIIFVCSNNKIPVDSHCDAEIKYNRIINIVCKYGQVSKTQLVSSSRSGRLPFYRNVAIQLCKTHVFTYDFKLLLKTFNTSSATISMSGRHLFQIQEDPSQRNLFEDYLQINKMVFYELFE